MEAATSSTIPAFGSAAARRVGGDGASFFPSAGRGTPRFWGKKQGQTVFLWESLDEEGKEECGRMIRTHRDWVVWSRDQ